MGHRQLHLDCGKLSTRKNCIIPYLIESSYPKCGHFGVVCPTLPGQRRPISPSSSSTGKFLSPLDMAAEGQCSPMWQSNTRLLLFPKPPRPCEPRLAAQVAEHLCHSNGHIGIWIIFPTIFHPSQTSEGFDGQVNCSFVNILSGSLRLQQPTQ